MGRKALKNNWVLFLFLSLFFFLVDFFVKKSAEVYLSPGRSYPLVKGLLSLTLVHNRGAVFGLFSGRTSFLIGAGLFLVIFFIFWLRKEQARLRDKFFLSMILGGAVSNLYDRIFLGYVVDYIDLGWWPVFNLSDSFITIGCLFFIVFSFKTCQE